MCKQFNQQQLKDWFVEHARSLPWREDPTPYRVWVSEVMLQQTRASVVIPYFERWMEVFPTIYSLSQAPIEQVLKLWEGLGYYSRARNLHGGAKFLVEQFGGELPSSPTELHKIKGLGPYTVGAIRSFAFKQKAAAVDGNVIRVLARYFAINDDISKPATVKRIWSLAEQILPEEEPWLVSEGLIELGASLCGKNPQCESCPLQEGCEGFRQGVASELPVKLKKIKTTHLYRMVFVVVSGDHYLVHQVKKGKVMSDLYEFPYIELSSPEVDFDSMEQFFLKEFNCSPSFVDHLPKEQHTFTRYKAHLYPILCTLPSLVESADYQWIKKEELGTLPFSSGHRRVLLNLLGSINDTITTNHSH